MYAYITYILYAMYACITNIIYSQVEQPEFRAQHPCKKSGGSPCL